VVELYKYDLPVFLQKKLSTLTIRGW